MAVAIRLSGNRPSPFYLTMLKDLYPDVVYENWIFRCEKHGEFEQVVAKGTQCIDCEMCKAEEQERKRSEDQRKIFEQDLVTKHGVPEAERLACFDYFEVRRDEGHDVEMADRAALSAVSELASPADGNSAWYTHRLRFVTVCGMTGQGKTWLGVSLIRALADQKRSCIYVPDSIIRDYRVSASKKRHWEILEHRLEQDEMVVIDDLDPDAWYRAGSSFLVDLMISRAGRGKGLLLLTNRPSNILFERFGDAAASRLKSGKIVNMIGEDRRRKLAQKAQTQGSLGF